MTELRLVIFDVDGTLVDSQAHILASMAGAFTSLGLPVPERDAVLGIVGLSLPMAMARLAPAHPDQNAALVAAYKDSFAALRGAADAAAQSPLYPGVAEVLRTLSAEDDTLLAVATGKSQRGLDHLMELHGWQGLFHSVQVADHHPSKPHPSMIETALRETGVDAARAVMVGDTTYDIEMAGAAGISALGVAWGYHPADALRAAGAVHVLREMAELPGALARLEGAA